MGGCSRRIAISLREHAEENRPRSSPQCPEGHGGRLSSYSHHVDIAVFSFWAFLPYLGISEHAGPREDRARCVASNGRNSPDAKGARRQVASTTKPYGR